MDLNSENSKKAYKVLSIPIDYNRFQLGIKFNQKAIAIGSLKEVPVLGILDHYYK